MRTIRLRVVLFFCFVAACSTVFAADDWKGMQVMPKSDQFHLVPENDVSSGAYQAPSLDSGDVYKIGWPAIVARTKGRWLYLEDDGGYSKPAVGGWVYVDDVVKVDDAGSHYTEELRKKNAAPLYWLRGIYWEEQNKPAVAIGDYREAAELDAKSGSAKLDDALIRLGRLVAKGQYYNGKGQYDKKNRAEWEQYFLSAQKIKPDRAQLYLDWGYALSQACSCGQTPASPTQQPGPRPQGKSAALPQSVSPQSAVPQSAVQQSAIAASAGRRIHFVSSGQGDSRAAAPEQLPAPAKNGSDSKSGCDCSSTDAGTSKNLAAAGKTSDALEQEALCRYQCAAAYSDRWWQVPFEEAELKLHRCDQDTDNGFMQPIQQYATADRLQQAEDLFNSAIRLNPNVSSSHRDLGETLRLESAAQGDATRLARLEDARQSAIAACVLSNYREDLSLRTLAQIYADLKDFDSAEDYADRASKAAADEANANRLVRLWLLYSVANSDKTEADRLSRAKLMSNEDLEKQILGQKLLAEVAENAKTDPQNAKKGRDEQSHGPLLPPNFILQSHSAYR